VAAEAVVVAVAAARAVAAPLAGEAEAEEAP